MTVNVRIDLQDIESVVKSISHELNGGTFVAGSEGLVADEETKQYHEQLCGALRSYRDALEEEALRYNTTSFEYFCINKVVVKIEMLLKDATS